MPNRKRHILIVDDSSSWRELLAMIFEEEYHVSFASNHTEALRALLQQSPPFDVVIVDICLVDSDPKNQDGIRLMRDMRLRKILTKPVVLTGYPDLETVKIALKDLAAFDYFAKYPSAGEGLDIKSLRSAVRQAAGEARALIIEDDPSWQDLLASVLINDGFEVDLASNPLEARKRLENHSYPVAIVDLKFGKESPERGIELLEYISGLEQQPQVVVISGYGTIERVRDAFERGHTRAFIFKHEFDPAHFRKTVRRAVSG